MDVIYTTSGGEWFRDSLNAVAAFTQSDTFSSMMVIATVLSVIATAVLWVRTHDMLSLLKWAMIFTIVTVLVHSTRPVQIIDSSNPSAVYQVDNVPVGLVLPATIVTSVGHGLVAGYELFLHLPDSLSYNETGMLFGATLVGSSTDYSATSPEQSDLFADYVENCVVGDILLNKKYTMSDLMNSTDPYTLIFSKPSPLRGLYTSTGTFQTCQTTAASLQKMMVSDTSSGGTTWGYYVRKFFGNTPERAALYGQLMGDSYQYFYGQSESASSIMRHNVTLNALRHGFAGYAARNGDTASLVNMSAESSFAKMRMSQATGAAMAIRTLPIMQTVLTGVLIGLFPLMITLVMISTLSLEIMKGYVYTLVYLQSWPVLFAILNSAMNSHLKSDTSGIPVTLSNLSERQQLFSDIGTTAGWLALSIPFLAMGIVKGLGMAVSQAGSYLGSSMQSASSDSSSRTVDGNWSFKNMQTDNVQGNKWDTNSTHANGQITNQTGSGALVTQTGDGGTVYNTTGAMSKLPMEVNFGKAQSSAAQRSARESQVESQSQLSGYNHSVNSASTQANQFSQQYGNSATMTSGADNAQGMNDTVAANKMVSAAKSYAQKNNMSFADAWSEMDTKTRQLQINAGIRGSAGLDSNRSFAGKLAGFATGASVKADIHGGIESSGSTGSQDSMNKTGTSGKDFSADKNSQELQDYREGRDVLTSHRTSQSGSHSDNTANTKLEQLSATLAEADSHYQQYTDSVTRSHEYSKIASESESMNAQTQSNYAQEFVGYVQAQAPERAEAVLTNTASPEIRADREQLAEQFMHDKVQSRVEGNFEANRASLSEGMPSVQNSVAPAAGNAYQHGEAEITNRTNNAAVRTDSADRASAMIDENNKAISSERLEINTVKDGINNNRDSLKTDHQTAENTYSAEHDKAQQAQDSWLPRFSEIREDAKKHAANLKDEGGDK